MIYPAITSHPGLVALIDPAKLMPARRHYNGSICRHGPRLLLAYRYERADGRSGVAIHALGKTWQPAGKTLLDLAPAEDGTDFEDPRLCEIMGALILTHVSVRHAPRGDGIFRQHISLVDIEAGTISERPTDTATEHEKNWTVWDADVGKRWLLKRPAFAWPWGRPSGGTPAMQDKAGRLIAFGHAHVPDVERCRRYNLFAMQIDPATAQVTHVSRRPLWWGSEDDLAIVSPRSHRWMPLCVFPAGLVIDEAEYLVSLGVNDSATAILRFGPDELDLVPVAELPASAPAAVDAAGATTPEGAVRVRVVGKRPLGEEGGPYRPGDEFFTTPARAAALGEKRVQILQK